MSNYNPRLFRHLALLQQIHRPLLVRFFQPHRVFLNNLGAGLPDVNDADTLNCEALHRALLSPADMAPVELVEALYLIDEVATEDGDEAIREEISMKLPGFQIDPLWSEAELAIAVWLQHPRIVEDAHARLHAFQPRRFFTWRSAEDFLPDMPEDLEGAVSAISTRLESFFQDADVNRNGPGQPPRRFRVFHYLNQAQPGTIRFLVRHAGKLQNAPSVNEAGDSYLALFRPEIYDVVVFNHGTRELRINAGSKLEQNAYALVFGERLCGDAETFVPHGHYTLDPLRDGPACLACLDTVGIRSVRLVEVALNHGGIHNEYEIRRATDIYATHFFQDGGFAEGVPFERAVFKVTFRHSEHVRKVTIKPPRTAIYMRDTDGDIIEQWLRARGFNQEEETADVATTPQEA